MADIRQCGIDAGQMMIAMEPNEKERKGEANPMRKIWVEKVTLNVGAGKDQAVLEKGMKLLKNITGIEPVKTVTKKRIQAWGLRPGLPIGCKITLRGKKADAILMQLLGAKDNALKSSQFDDDGNVAFGIHEYIDIPGIKYDPDIKIMGLEVCITLCRNGFRIKRRMARKKRVPKKHRIRREDSIKFMQEKYNVKVEEE